MRRHCGCGRPKQIVHPTKENVVHCCTEEVVNHIHPSHTTVVNHHLIKNKHYYPHSTSVKNTMNETNVNCGSGPTGPPVGMGPGSMQPGMPPGNNMGPGNMNPGMSHGGKCPGSMQPGMPPGHNMGPGSMHPGMSPGNMWSKPGK